MNINFVQELRSSINEQSERGLIAATKWSSELLMSVAPQRRTAKTDVSSPELEGQSTPPPFPLPTHHPSLPPSLHGPTFTSLRYLPSPVLSNSYLPPLPEPLSAEELRVDFDLEEEEQDVHSAALNLFSERQFLRTCHLLQSRGCKSNKAKFLLYYSRFMDAERNAIREWHQFDQSRAQAPAPVNESLAELLEYLHSARDPYLLFLKALMIIRLAPSPGMSTRRPEAIQCLLASLSQRPWNWSAWTLLGNCVDSLEELLALMPHLTASVRPRKALSEPINPILPPNHPIPSLFGIHIRQALHAVMLPWDANECERLLREEWFPGSAWIKSLRAGIALVARDFQYAHSIFSNVLTNDPARVDNIEIFGEVLANSKQRLANVAWGLLGEIDKERTRPEVCCVVAMYYSLRSDHEKAITFLRRATELDRTNVNGWILLGSEYLLMGNAHAGIQSYRRSLEISVRDYRAWLGLGKAYMSLCMPSYALHYFQRAMALRPGDWRVYIEQACAFEELQKTQDALYTAKVAQKLFNTEHTAYAIPMDPHRSTLDDSRIHALLGVLYRRTDDVKLSAACHRRVVELAKSDGRQTSTYILSLLECAEWESSQPDGNWMLAQTWCEKVMNSQPAATPEEQMRASDLARTLRVKLLESRSDGGGSATTMRGIV